MALPLILGIGALAAGAYYLTKPKAKTVSQFTKVDYVPLPPPPPPPPPTYPIVDDNPHGPVAEEGGNNPE